MMNTVNLSQILNDQVFKRSQIENPFSINNHKIRKPKYPLRVDHYLRYFIKQFVKSSDFYSKLPLSYFFVLSDVFYRSLVLTDRYITLDQILITSINLCNKYYVNDPNWRPKLEIDTGIEREILLNLDGIFYNFQLVRACRNWSSLTTVIKDFILSDNSDIYLDLKIDKLPLDGTESTTDHYLLQDLVDYLGY